MKKQEFDLLRAMDGIPEDMANDALPARFGGRHPVRQIIRSRRKALWAAAVAAVVGLNVFAVTEIRKAMRTAPPTATTDTEHSAADPGDSDAELRKTRQPIPEAVELTALPDLSAFGIDTSRFEKTQETVLNDMIERQAGIKYPAIPMSQITAAGMDMLGFTEPEEAFTVWRSPDEAVILTDRWGFIRYYAAPAETRKQAALHSSNAPAQPELDKAAQFVQAMLPAGAEAGYGSMGLMQYTYSIDTDAAALQCMVRYSVTGAGGSGDEATLWLTEDGTVLEYGAFFCHYVGGDSPAEEEELMGFAKLLSDTLIRNPARYRVRSIPALGALLKEEDLGHEQLSLLED